MPRLTADQWAAIRIEWEGEPKATFSALAEKYGVNKSEVSRTANRQAWVKTGQLAGINDAAKRKEIPNYMLTEKYFQNTLFKNIESVCRIYDLPEVKRANREYRIDDSYIDIFILHADDSITLIECKRAGLGLRDYLTGIGQLLHARIQMLRSSIDINEVRAFLAVPSVVVPSVGFACLDLGVSYMPYGTIEEHMGIE